MIEGADDWHVAEAATRHRNSEFQHHAEHQPDVLPNRRVFWGGLHSEPVNQQLSSEEEDDGVNPGNWRKWCSQKAWAGRN